MKFSRKNIFLLIIIFLIIGSFIIYRSLNISIANVQPELQYKKQEKVGDNLLALYLKKFVPNNIKQFAKDTLFVFKKVSVLEKQVQMQDGIITELNNQKRYFEFFSNKSFVEKKKLGNTDLIFTKYNSKLFEAISSRSYIDYDDKYLFLINENGILSYASINEIKKNKVIFNIIDSNIDEFILKKPSVKNLLIKENKIYISFVKEINEKCFTNAILVGNKEFGKILFKEFINLNECQPSLDVQAGGNLSEYNENNILMTIGDYSNPSNWKNGKTQSLESTIGKIISINENSKDYKILSMGHRNSQGLYYDKDDKIIYSTDHGPQGGDEINLNFSPDEKVKNYGWPISSYGEHYGFPDADNKEYYELAPLNKSHSKFGFIEPLFYFVPSIAITQIVKTNDFINIPNKNIIYVSALGSKINEGDLSIHQFILNKNFEIDTHNILPIGERIRDFIYIKKTNKIIMTLDTTNSLGILEIDN